MRLSWVHQIAEFFCDLLAEGVTFGHVACRNVMVWLPEATECRLCDFEGLGLLPREQNLHSVAALLMSILLWRPQETYDSFRPNVYEIFGWQCHDLADQVFRGLVEETGFRAARLGRPFAFDEDAIPAASPFSVKEGARAEPALLGRALSAAKRAARRIFGRVYKKKWNVLIDRVLRPAEEKEVEGLFCARRTVDRPPEAFWEWIEKTSLPFRSLSYPHKKAVEFFFSSEILDVRPEDRLLDAAGGRSGYLDAIRATRRCEHLHLHDHIYSGMRLDPDGTSVVGGDIGAIALPEGRLDKIACHHAFEHFQGDKDTAWIREIGRLLAPGGRACIIPIFIADRFVECWNIDRVGVFDSAARLVIDKTASIPGGDEDGHFARFYDPAALRRRILKAAEAARLVPSVALCRLGGEDLPDMEKNFGSCLNRPLRALVLDKPA
ncbi:MAG: methyltransferase domain-containing protein [Planctomycetota bacterium]